VMRLEIKAADDWRLLETFGRHNLAEVQRKVDMQLVAPIERGDARCTWRIVDGAGVVVLMRSAWSCWHQPDALPAGYKWVS
jgi:hypothetical protein